MQILNSLVPIFSVIGLGILLRKRTFLSEETTQGFNRFAYYFALPLFLFYKIGEAPSGTGTANLFVTTLLAASVLTALASWGLTHLLGTQAGSRGALIQAGFRGNLAFMGLPLVLFTIYELPEDQRVQIETAILIALAPVVIFYNVASVAALAVYNQQTESTLSSSKVLRNIVLNPLLIACVAGLIVRTTGWTIPTTALRTCEVVGASAFPLALLGIGSQLASITVSGQWTDSLIASGLKCILCPLIGWLVARWIGLVGIELQVIVIMCAMPTAVSSYVLADQMKGDADLAASAVVIGTAFSFLTLSILLALTF